jgi:hypothetical protein
VDDKTIRGAREAKIPLRKFTEQFKQAFFEDIETLRIKRADEFPSATDRFVVHVGDVHHAMHFVTAQFKMSLKEIFEDIGAKVSNVRPAVNGWPARVNANLALGGIARFEFFDLARVGVKKAHLSCRAKSRHLSFYPE